MSYSAVKNEIRKAILEQSNELSKDEVISKSRIVLNRLSSLNELNKDSILLYLSKDKEVMTHNLIMELLKRGKCISVPVFSYNVNSMKASRIFDVEREIEQGIFNILQPKKEFIRPVLQDAIDLVIVPGIAFDEKGGRIGRGKGYYDRFLGTFPPHVDLIALAFEYQIVPYIPICENDIKMNKIVTEARIIDCDATRERLID